MIQYEFESIKHKGSGLEVVLGDALYEFLKQALNVVEFCEADGPTNEDCEKQVVKLCDKAKAFNEKWELTV